MILKYPMRILCVLSLVGLAAAAGHPQGAIASADTNPNGSRATASDPKPLVVSVVADYYSQEDGVPLADIVKSAFGNNGDIKIARLEVEKARARLRQAGVRPNPTLEVEQSTGSLVGSSGERELSVGVSVPLDVYGQRQRRIDLAQA